MSIHFYFALVALLGGLFVFVLVEAFRSLSELDDDPDSGDSG